jgi:hypothetical protein
VGKKAFELGIKTISQGCVFGLGTGSQRLETVSMIFVYIPGWITDGQISEQQFSVGYF